MSKNDNISKPFEYYGKKVFILSEDLAQVVVPEQLIFSFTPAGQPKPENDLKD